MTYQHLLKQVATGATMCLVVGLLACTDGATGPANIVTTPLFNAASSDNAAIVVDIDNSVANWLTGDGVCCVRVPVRRHKVKSNGTVKNISIATDGAVPASNGRAATFNHNNTGLRAVIVFQGVRYLTDKWHQTVTPRGRGVFEATFLFSRN